MSIENINRAEIFHFLQGLMLQERKDMNLWKNFYSFVVVYWNVDSVGRAHQPFPMITTPIKSTSIFRKEYDLYEKNPF